MQTGAQPPAQEAPAARLGAGKQDVPGEEGPADTSFRSLS